MSVKVTWKSETEVLDATVTHALLIIPEGPENHRVFFFAKKASELGQMLAVAMEIGATMAGGLPIQIALDILKRPERGEFRGPRATPEESAAYREGQLHPKARYSCHIAWSPEDGEYVATSPELPGLSALGETREDALREWGVALGLMLDVMEDDAVPAIQTKQQQDERWRRGA